VSKWRKGGEHLSEGLGHNARLSVDRIPPVRSGNATPWLSRTPLGTVQIDVAAFQSREIQGTIETVASFQLEKAPSFFLVR
jgi:hypothetical protein